MAEKLKVFVCHASENRSTAKELVDRLKSDGFEPWLDSEQLLPGTTWDLEIQKAMKASGAVIVCFSKASVEKEGYVQKEIKFATELQKEKPEGVIFLMPVLLDECEIPYSLRDVQWVKYFDADGYEKIIRALNQRANQLGQKNAESISLPFVIQTFSIEPWLCPLHVQKYDEEDGPQDLLSALNKNRRIILAGNSGSGKTNALKAICNELNQSANTRCCLIPLKNYSKNLGHTIKENLNWHNVLDDQVISILERQNVTLLLDGLNEVTVKDQEDCIKEIDALLSTYRGQVCVSYALTDISYFGLEYPLYRVLPLRKGDIEKVVKDFFKVRGISHKTDWFLQSVRGWDLDRQQDFDKLASLPINLQFLLELAQDSDFSYNSLGDLYGRVIQKRLERTKLHSQRNQLSTDIKTDCLMRIAYQAILQDHQLQMPKEFVRSILLDVTNSAKADVNLALKEIIRAGLLLEVNDFLIEWPHSSFKDYLAGRYLYNLVETDRSIDEFPLDKPNGATAAAHATRLLTTQSRKLENRPVVFMSVLTKAPSLDIIKSIAGEYHTALDYYQGQNISCDRELFIELKWGERFLKAFRLIKLAAEKNGLPGTKEISAPMGLRVFFDSKSDFCLVIFSDEKGIQINDLEIFNHPTAQRQRHKKSKRGFCLFAPFLLLLDPEIMAYREFGVWLRLIPSENNSIEDVVSNWHHELAINICPKNEWLYWCQSEELPNPDFEICASPQETMEFLYKNYGRDQVDQIKSTMDILTRSTKVFLLWEEIYMPITIQIDATKTTTPSGIVSGRANQIMLRKLLNHNISLVLLLPPQSGIKKMNPLSMIYVPFPVNFLDRYYFLYNHQELYRDGKMSSLSNLRG